jgi:DNA-binding CsgD family transcriptional regulator
MNTPANLSSPKSSQQGFIGQRPALSPQDESSLLACALDEIACAVLIVDGRGHLQHANLAGQALLQRGQALALHDHALTAKDLADAPKLGDALAKALKGKRSMITLGAQQQSTVAVVPLDRHSDRSPAASASSEPRIALIFSRTGMCEALMMSFFARAYSLTRAEEQVLSLLCVGHTAPEMAQQLRVGEATVRTHIRSICQKTHSNGIREVTKRLALLPPLMAAVMPGTFA